jgi:hypothetical protein
VEKSKEFGDLSVPEHNYKISTINEFLGELIMVTCQTEQSEINEVIYKEINKRNEIKVTRQM